MIYCIDCIFNFRIPIIKVFRLYVSEEQPNRDKAETLVYQQFESDSFTVFPLIIDQHNKPLLQLWQWHYSSLFDWISKLRLDQ